MIPQGHQRGFSLIELVIFIVVIGIAAAAVALLMVNTLRGTGVEDEVARAAYLAQERTEVILAHKRRNNAFTADPCDEGVLDCTGPYTVTAEFDDWPDGDPEDYQVLTVTVTAPSGGSYTMSTLVADFTPIPQ